PTGDDSALDCQRRVSSHTSQDSETESNHSLDSFVDLPAKLPTQLSTLAMKKWNTDSPLNQCSISRPAVFAKSNSTGMFTTPPVNPLKKWRESLPAENAKSLALGVAEDDEVDLGVSLATRSDPSLDPSGESPRAMEAIPEEDEGSEDYETDNSSLERERPKLGEIGYAEDSEATFARLSEAARKSASDLSLKKEEKKGFLRDILSRTKHSLALDTKIPKPAIKSPSPAADTKIPKLGSIKLSSFKPQKKTPLLKRLYNLSKVKAAKEKVPELDPAKLKIFDNLEEDEFADDTAAQWEIARFLKNYTIVKQIGTGGHSTVRLATRNADNAQVVAKFIHSSNVWHWCNSRTNHKLPLEINMMKTFTDLHLNHVIQYHEHYAMGQRYIIIMEYLGQDWIDLYDYIEFFGPVEEATACKIFKSVCETIQKMHSLGYSHNDIKDENVMINKKTLDIKLIDFGSTMPLTLTPTTTFYGTQKFSSPEALCGNPYVLAHQEVWALGTLLYVLLFKMDPFANDEEILELDISRRMHRLRTSTYGKNLPPIKISDEAAEAIMAMLSKDPLDRPRVDELLDLDFFAVN
ncbi:hypothetical protein HDU91_006296, partial [Kappamyces sp. JEL0680]